jgi:hypothetical protein
MGIRLTAFLLALGLAACGVVSCPDRRLSSSDRPANDHERAYVLIAAATGSAEPCGRISPRAYAIDAEAPRGLNVILARSECWARAAERSGDAGACERVVSVSSFRHDGSDFDADRCRERATGNPEAPVEVPPNLDALLEELRYTSDVLGDRCLEFVRLKHMTERALAQESYVHCLNQRASEGRGNPGEDGPTVCWGPHNRRPAFDACLAARLREVEESPERYPAEYVNGCRRLLRFGSEPRRRFEACVDHLEVLRHREPEHYARPSEEACREQVLTYVSGPEFFADGAWPVCPMVLQAHPRTFEWRIDPDAFSERARRERLWAALLESGEVVDDLNRLPELTAPTGQERRPPEFPASSSARIRACSFSSSAKRERTQAPIA